MKPARIDWATGNNEDGRFAIALALKSGAVFALTDYTAFQMDVKVSPFAPEAEVTLTDTDGLTIDSANGRIEGRMPESAVSDLLGAYVYEIRGTRTDGSHDVIVKGNIGFGQGVTY